MTRQRSDQTSATVASNSKDSTGPEAGKLTRTQSFPQSPAATAAQRSAPEGKEALRADPWVMDNASMAAMGLCPSDEGPQPEEGSPHKEEITPWWEPQLRTFLQMSVPPADPKLAQIRLDMVLGTIRAMSDSQRSALRARLENSPAKDELAGLFLRQLEHPSRERVLAALRGSPVASEPAEKSAPEDSPDSDTARGRSGQDGMWQHVIGEASSAVGKLARVRAPKGVRLRARPAADQPTLGILPFDALISVERRTEHGWCWVVPMGQLAGTPGFCEEQFLSIDPPEPTAHLHLVAPGDSIRVIAERYYGKQFRDGRDGRLYVQALYEANKAHKGIYLTEVDLDRSDTIHRGEEEERTLEIYKGAKVREGHVLWLPSEAFIEHLRAGGAITSGTSIGSQIWRGAKAAAREALDTATYGAAFTVGLMEGAWSAIVELFQGAADMIQLVAKTAYHLITGNPGAIRDMLMGWVDKLKGAWASRDKLADAFMQKWESDDAWTRGNFQGEVLGWVMMTALLILVTAGQASLAMAPGKWASVLKVLHTVDALGDVTVYAGKVVQLPGKAAEVVRRRLDRGAKDVANAADDVLDAEGDVARAVTHTGAGGHPPRRGDKGNKPQMETVTTSLDGHTFHNDFRKMSGSARHVIRQLEARGWVRVSEIDPQDLVDVSKWFGVEIGVVQNAYGKLRIILGTERGVVLKQIGEGEVFVMHTHPVAVSETKHFRKDLANADMHTEAVIDWMGNITYYNKAGIRNSKRQDGTIEPLLDFKAAFMDSNGIIVGYARIDIIDQTDGAIVKVKS